MHLKNGKKKQNNWTSEVEDVSPPFRGAFSVLNRSVAFCAFKPYLKPSYATEIYMQIKLHTFTMESR